MARPLPLLVPFLAVACACAGAAPHAHEGGEARQRSLGGFEYRVRVDPSLTRLDVTLCFPGDVPERLVASRESSADALVGAEVRTPGADRTPLQRDGASLSLSEVGSGGCAGYIISLERLLGSRWTAMRHADAVLVDSAGWLWRPAGLGDDETGTLAFDMPDGLDAAACWPMDGDRHRIDRSTFRFLSHTVFGRFERDRVSVPGAELSLVLLEGETRMSRDEILTWIRTAGSTSAQLLGRFPADHAQVTVVPAPVGDDPVAFGNVGRGGGASVMLILRSNATLDELEDDWVTPHEFSHLAMPYVRRPDAWLSEGFATYYQEVLRARAGLQSPLAAWRALDGGFTSGRRDGTGRTLEDESAAMFETHAFRRVYWAGTALMLMIDVALRSHDGPPASLDAAIHGLLECCVDMGDVWTAQEMIRAIDRLAGAPLFAAIADPALESTAFPDLEPVYAFLGLRRDEAGRLQLVDAPGATIRDAIMAPVVEPVSDGSFRAPAARASACRGRSCTRRGHAP